MNLTDIPSESVCVADSNILLYAEQGISREAQEFVRRCSEDELTVILPQTVWQELIHKLMVAEAVMLDKVRGPSPAGKLARKTELIKELGTYRDKIAALISLGMKFESCTREDVLERGLLFQEKYGMMTNDSVILASAVRVKADVLVSADAVFQNVKELMVACPSDIVDYGKSN